MTICDLINRLKMLDNDLFMMAKIGTDASGALFIDIFGNSNGHPTIHLLDEEPLPSAKKCGILFKELEMWAAGSIHYQPDANIYLVNSFDYDDGSYDFRYFKLEDVVQEGCNVLLIGSPRESIVLREHFEAFDEDMFDPE